MTFGSVTKLKDSQINFLYKNSVKIIDNAFVRVKIAFSKFDTPKMLIVISKKVGCAVYRNYLRRVCKNVYKIHESFLHKYDLIISFKPACKKNILYKDIHLFFLNLISKLSAIK
jgi:ribonuclease P protein component